MNFGSEDSCIIVLMTFGSATTSDFTTVCVCACVWSRGSATTSDSTTACVCVCVCVNSPRPQTSPRCVHVCMSCFVCTCACPSQRHPTFGDLRRRRRQHHTTRCRGRRDRLGDNLLGRRRRHHDSAGLHHGDRRYARRPVGDAGLRRAVSDELSFDTLGRSDKVSKQVVAEKPHMLTGSVLRIRLVGSVLQATCEGNANGETLYTE